MRTIVLFIAMSLDGYIADPAGGVGWLNGQEDTAEDPGQIGRASCRERVLSHV